MSTSKVFLLLICLLVSCVLKPSITTFTPPPESLLQITFSYPANWKLRFESRENRESRVYALDPYFPNNGELGHENSGVIIDVVITDKPQKDLQAELEQQREWISDQFGLPVELLADEDIELGGFPAHRFVEWVESPHWDGFYLAHHVEEYFLPSMDRYYVIALNIPESEVEGCFH